MNYYKELRKDASLTREEKVQRIDAYLTSLAAPFRQAFGARRPHWRDLLGWIEEVEFQIPWTAVNRYSAMKRMWRFQTTIPAVTTTGRMLDVGCGLGTDAILLHLSTGVRIAGIDMDDLSLDTCRVRLRHYRDWLGLSADAIADPSRCGDPYREAEEVATDHPFETRVAGTELLTDRGQRDVDDGDVEYVHEHTDDERHGDNSLVRPRRDSGHAGGPYSVTG